MQVQLQQIIIPPGQQILMTDISWEMYEQILTAYENQSGSRINYSQGVLEIMVPLPEHEADKVIISDLIKILLEELDQDFWSLGSTTFRSKKMQRGLEADDCFYMESETAIRGKKRIDLDVDPPPDLALVIDITARTRFDIYQMLEVKELWRFDGTGLEINVLEAGKYVQVEESPHFLGFPLQEVIPEYLERSKTEGRNKIMKAFRRWVRTKIDGQAFDPCF